MWSCFCCSHRCYSMLSSDSRRFWMASQVMACYPLH